MKNITIKEEILLKEKAFIFFHGKKNITKDIIYYLIDNCYQFKYWDFNLSLSYLYGDKEKIIKALNGSEFNII